MFENCNNAKETREELIKIIQTSSLSRVQENLSKSFYNMDSEIAFLYNSILAGGNGILYGPGGFGKTDITKAFFRYYNIEPIVIVGHSETNVESLLGIPNIKKLTDESIYEIAFEKSVFSKTGVLILEEFLDVKPSVAAALKDIITSGGYRRGDEFVPSKIGAIFICSNKAPDEVVIDYSTAAFYKERFPFSKYVIWNDYSSKEYLNLFKLVYKDTFEEKESSFKLIAELCSASCNKDNVISPRMAFHAMNLFLIDQDIKILSIISSINTTRLDEITHKLKLEEQYKSLYSKFVNLISIVSGLNLEDINMAMAFYAKGRILRDMIENSSIEGDDLLNVANNLRNQIESRLLEAERTIIDYGESININTFDEIYEDVRKFLS